MIKIGRYEINNTAMKTTKYKWVAWNSASFARAAQWFMEAKMNPSEYKEGADKTFALMAMSNFEELWNLDKECADMVGSSWSYVITEMMNVLGPDGKKFKRTLTF